MKTKLELLTIWPTELTSCFNHIHANLTGVNGAFLCLEASSLTLCIFSLMTNGFHHHLPVHYHFV